SNKLIFKTMNPVNYYQAAPRLNLLPCYLKMMVLHVNKLLMLALICCSFTALAQNQPVKLPGIPFPLSWENMPLNYSVNGGVLTIEAGAKTDMFRDPNVTYNTDNAPKLLFT